WEIWREKYSPSALRFMVAKQTFTRATARQPGSLKLVSSLCLVSSAFLVAWLLTACDGTVSKPGKQPSSIVLGSYSYTPASSHVIDQALTEARNTVIFTERVKFYHQFLERLVQQVYIIPLYVGV